MWRVVVACGVNISRRRSKDGVCLSRETRQLKYLKCIKYILIINFQDKRGKGCVDLGCDSVYRCSFIFILRSSVKGAGKHKYEEINRERCRHYVVESSKIENRCGK